MKNDRDRMKCIISETIIALCNSGLDFSSELSVEGLLGITLDGRDIMLVNIKEVIKSGVTGTKKSSSRTSDSISEVATSSDPAVEVFVERHATTNDVYSRNHKQRSNSSSKVTTRNQTDHVTETVKMQVKSEPEEVISINDEEGHDSIFDDTRLECYPQIGFWIENSNNTNADSVQQLVSEVAVSHSSVVQGSQSNIHTSDKFCKMVQSTTDTLCTPLKGYQQNCLGTMTTPVSLYANVLPQHVSLSAASVHRQSHTQTFVTPYQRQRYRCYSQTALVDAVTAVRSHKMTARRASQIFKVPRSTIQMKLLKLAGKKTWGSHCEKQQCSGGSLQDVSSETSELHDEAMHTEDQQQNNCSLQHDSDAG